MRLLRSWPVRVPGGRAHVVDSLDRHMMNDYCYRGLANYADDILLLEWDIAIDLEGLDRFRRRAANAPNQVMVAPYRLYQATVTPTPLPGGPRWAHRVYTGNPDPKTSIRHVQDADDPTADLWGMGMVYLPRHVLREYVEFTPGILNDGSFSGWHYDQYGPVPIAWDVRPIHLHYSIEERP